jgi:hypothetical protein
MAGNDRVRHCAQCNLNVYNFSAMTSAEAEELISNHQGRLCGRLYQRRDGTFLTSDCANSFQVRIRWVTRVAGIALSAATIGMNFAAAQTTSNSSQSRVVQIQQKESGISVEILDPTGAVIPKAHISLVDESGKVKSALTGEDGTYNAPNLLPGIYKVTVQMNGFSEVHEEVRVVQNKITLLHLTMAVGLVGEVVSIPLVVAEPEASDVSVPKIEPRNSQPKPVVLPRKKPL